MSSPYPLATRILDELSRQMPFLHRAAVQSDVCPMAGRMEELEFIGVRLEAMLGQPADWIAEVVKAYVVLSIEFLRLQKELERTGSYLLSSEQEARERVYHNAQVFGGYYLPGQLLSQALWINHFRIDEAYRNRFLPRLKAGSEVVEVGVGPGYHLRHLLEKVPEVRYLGLDISDYAIDFSRKFALGEGPENSGVRLVNRNISDGSGLEPASVDAVILGELLEHVEDPKAVLEDLWRAARPQAPAFISTVVFMANIDHIHLFEKADEIRDLVTGSGWRIAEEWPLPLHPDDTPEMARRPINYAAILEKAR